MPKSRLGEKISRWLDDQRRAGKTPASEAALAEVLGVSQPTVNRWVMAGRRPRGDRLRRLSMVMGIDALWLTDDDERDWPPPPEAYRLDVVLAELTPEERRAVVSALGDARIRQALVAFGAAQAQPGGKSPPAGTPRKER